MSVAQFDFDVASRVAPAWAGAGECRFMSSWAPEIFNQLSLLFAAFGLSTEPLRRLLDNGGAFEGMAMPCDSISGEVAQAASKLARASSGRPAFTGFTAL